MEFIFTLPEIKQVAARLYELGKQKKVWALHGGMGAGKTTFVTALCENLGVTSSVGSPTYSIINEYTSSEVGLIYHMDWYRIKDEEEALQAGVEEILSGDYFCLIEWPERATALLPDNCFHLTIALENHQKRRITII